MKRNQLTRKQENEKNEIKLKMNLNEENKLKKKKKEHLLQDFVSQDVAFLSKVRSAFEGFLVADLQAAGEGIEQR